MSRPDTRSDVADDEPRVPRAHRTVHRRPAAVPLRVVAHRLTADELAGARGADSPSAEERAIHGSSAHASAVQAYPCSTVPATGAVATLAQPPLPSPPVVGLPVRARPLPVIDRRPRRSPFARLVGLVLGRRRAEAGRHRPDTTPSRGWSMFAPHRRDRRRFGVRR